MIERIGVFLGLLALIGLAAGSNGFQIDSMTFSLASDYINISGNADLTKYKGSGTAEDPYIIEGLNLKDHVGNGIVIRDTDAYILIKNCTMENLSGGYMGLSALGMIIDNAKNIQINDCRISGSDLLISKGENIQIDNCNTSTILFDGVKNSTIINSTSGHFIIEPTGVTLIVSPPPGVVPFNQTRIPSQNCLIKSCRAGWEMAFFDSKDCVVEDCYIENGGLWTFNLANSTFSNVTVANGTLGIHSFSSESTNLTFEKMNLIKTEIYLAGFDPAGYSYELRNSTADGKEIYYYEDKKGLNLKGLKAGHIWLVNCPGAMVDEVEANGVFVVNSTGATIENSEIDQDGIHLAFSKDCVIANSTLYNPRKSLVAKTAGIMLDIGCSNNTLSHNIITRTRKTGSDYSSSLGIATTQSGGNNIIVGNIVRNAGIGVEAGRNNTIVENTMVSNVVGIKVSDDYNKITQNNFIYNGIDAQQKSEIAWKKVSFTNNTWDGNFWTSYQGVDMDGDGAGDTPYLEPVGWPRAGEREPAAEEPVVDRAPRMEPFQ
mgnify:CR=1 FL=1